jgi:uncharacterized membrane protein YgdD (TMEM256/DUF423 family)
MNQKFTGALMVSTGIALGAFGAHGLRGQLEAGSMDVYQTAVFYLLINGLGLMFMNGLTWPARLLLIGILCFSGSLFILSTSSIHGFQLPWLGPLTPLGGVLMIVSWVWAGLDWRKAKKNEKQADI